MMLLFSSTLIHFLHACLQPASVGSLLSFLSRLLSVCERRLNVSNASVQDGQHNTQGWLGYAQLKGILS